MASRPSNTITPPEASVTVTPTRHVVEYMMGEINKARACNDKQRLAMLRDQVQQYVVPLVEAREDRDEVEIAQILATIANHPEFDSGLKDAIKTTKMSNIALAAFKKMDEHHKRAEADHRRSGMIEGKVVDSNTLLRSIDGNGVNATSGRGSESGNAHENGNTSGVKQVPTPDPDARAKLEARIEELKKVAKDDEEERKALVVEATRETEVASKAAKQTKDPYKALEAKIIDLYAEQRRREKEEVKARSLWQAETTNVKRQLDKTIAEKKRYEEISRTLAKERNVLREDHKKLESRMKDLEETVQKHIKALPTTYDDSARTSPGDPPPSISPYNPRPKNEQPSEILITVASRNRTDLWFRISRTAKLKVLFDAWRERMADSSYEEQQQTLAKGNKKGKGKKKDVKALIEGLPKFVFTLYGKALTDDMTPLELDMRDKDEIAAFELVDLTEDLTADFPKEAAKKLEKYWTTSSKDALDSLEEILEIVTRERLKSIIRQYEIREEHWISIMHCKDLELLITNAKLEAISSQAKTNQTTNQSTTLPAHLPLPPATQPTPTESNNPQFAQSTAENKSTTHSVSNRATARPVRPLPSTNLTSTIRPSPTPPSNVNSALQTNSPTNPTDPNANFNNPPLSKGDLASIHLHINYGMIKDQVTSLSKAVTQLLSVQTNQSNSASVSQTNAVPIDPQSSFAALADIKKVQTELERILPALQKTRDDYGADEATMLRVRRMVAARQGRAGTIGNVGGSGNASGAGAGAGDGTVSELLGSNIPPGSARRAAPSSGYKPEVTVDGTPAMDDVD